MYRATLEDDAAGWAAFAKASRPEFRDLTTGQRVAHVRLVVTGLPPAAERAGILVVRMRVVHDDIAGSGQVVDGMHLAPPPGSDVRRLTESAPDSVSLVIPVARRAVTGSEMTVRIPLQLQPSGVAPAALRSALLQVACVKWTPPAFVGAGGSRTATSCVPETPDAATMRVAAPPGETLVRPVLEAMLSEPLDARNVLPAPHAASVHRLTLRMQWPAPGAAGMRGTLTLQATPPAHLGSGLTLLPDPESPTEHAGDVAALADSTGSSGTSVQLAADGRTFHITAPVAPNGLWVCRLRLRALIPSATVTVHSASWWTAATQTAPYAMTVGAVPAVRPWSTVSELGWVPAQVPPPQVYLTPRVQAPQSSTVRVGVHVGAGDVHLSPPPGVPIADIALVAQGAPQGFAWVGDTEDATTVRVPLLGALTSHTPLMVEASFTGPAPATITAHVLSNALRVATPQGDGQTTVRLGTGDEA